MKTILVDRGIAQWQTDTEYDQRMELEIIGKFRDPHKAIALAKKENVNLALVDIGILEQTNLWTESMKSRVFIRTFGKFEVYLDGCPVKFTSTKAKEILALLVYQNGESITEQYAFEKMWESVLYTHTQGARYRRALKKLINTLEVAGIESILSCFPQKRTIRKDMVECDFFRILDEDPKVIQDYKGIFMQQYSWAEPMVEQLNQIKLKYEPGAISDLYDEK